MHSSTGQWVILAVPVLMVLALATLSWRERRALGPDAPPGFIARNGWPVASFLILAVVLWTVFMIVLPLLSMIDLSFRPRLPPAQWGNARDIYTLDHYRFFLFGSNTSTDSWNVTHLKAFGLTILVSILVTALDFCICYPVAFYMAKVARPARLRLMMLMLIAPYWVNELLRAFAFRLLFSNQGLINRVLMSLGLTDQPVDFIAGDVALYSGLAYAYLLMMMFALYNAIETLDRNLIEAARDLGAPWWHIHAFIVIPHAKPGIGSGATLVFMLTAGSLAAPLILAGPRSLWFTPIVYDRFYQAFNWQQGAAYALILLVACIIFVLGVLKLFRLGLGEIAK
ncbi:ABC transporter permease [Roseomonas sp. GC11]|uniref:ABC transporter permease n=1 Tax=Roseomonas sp. GC11 TaxID=2950546 RepID=UPI00210ACE86|nr:ABC transporter permease [Roseomonas sp. GC11]MCQ4160207.1 ABC transporter permease [Roseomonas sp. GC11]